MDNSVTIVVPCFNEEKNLPLAIRDLLVAMKKYPGGFEIIIVDDGSPDATGKVADQLAHRHAQLRVIHHPTNRGLGAAFRSGIAAARKTWLVPFHGDNDSSARSLRRMIDRIGEADIITAYNVNMEIRPLLRRVISYCLVLTMNRLFHLHLRYYTGYFISKTDTLRSMLLQASGPAIYVEAKVRMLKRGASVLEMPFTHTGRKYGVSTTINMKNLVDTLMTIGRLVRDTGKIQ